MSDEYKTLYIITSDYWNGTQYVSDAPILADWDKGWVEKELARIKETKDVRSSDQQVAMAELQVRVTPRSPKMEMSEALGHRLIARIREVGRKEPIDIELALLEIIAERDKAKAECDNIRAHYDVLVNNLNSSTARGGSPESKLFDLIERCARLQAIIQAVYDDAKDGPGEADWIISAEAFKQVESAARK
jgi:hypothetical protein